MKNFIVNYSKLLVFALVAAFASCKKFDQGPSSNNDIAPAAKSINYANQVIFTPSQHVFTDVQICYDDKVFLLEDGKLKRLINNELVTVDLPASIYANFHPTHLTISKDYTFY